MVEVATAFDHHLGYLHFVGWPTNPEMEVGEPSLRGLGDLSDFEGREA